MVVPWSGPVPLVERRRDHRAVVARLEVAVLVLFIDHRLGRERLAGRRRRRRLGLDHQLAGRRRADDDVGGRGHAVRPPLVKLSEIVSALLSARFVNVATPPGQRDGGRPLERAGAARQRRRHHRAVVAGFQVAELVLFIDDWLDARTPARPWPSTTAGCGSPTGWPPPG